jgi:hypothetical protein
MLASIATELACKFINNIPKEIMKCLSKMFMENAHKEHLMITLAFTRCNMMEGSSIN